MFEIGASNNVHHLLLRFNLEVFFHFRRMIMVVSKEMLPVDITLELLLRGTISVANDRDDTTKFFLVGSRRHGNVVFAAE